MSDQRMTTAEVLEAIARERARLMTAVESLGAEASSLPISDEGWTAKDLLASLIHWAGQIAFGLGAPLEPPAYVSAAKDRPPPEQWNARAVAFYRYRSLQEVRAELERTIDALVARVQLCSDEQINATDAIPWAGTLPLWQQLGIETFDNWRSRSELIERAGRAARARS